MSEDLVREVRRRQRAVVALVFNFAPPSRSSRDDPLLSLHEVTLEGFMRDPVVVHLTMYVCRWRLCITSGAMRCTRCCPRPLSNTYPAQGAARTSLRWAHAEDGDSGLGRPLIGLRGVVLDGQVPAHLLEYFSRSSEVLSLWAGHYITGEPPPKQVRTGRGSRSSTGMIGCMHK